MPGTIRSLWDNAYQHKLFTEAYETSDTFGTVPGFKEVYLGHTPATNYSGDQPLNAFNIWNLDTGAGHAGRLTIMDVDRKEFWQSDRVGELYGRDGK